MGFFRAVGRDGRLLLLIGLTGVTIVVLGAKLVWWSAERMLRADSRAAGIQWADYLSKQISDLERILANGEVSASDLEAFRAAVDVGGVFRYHIFAPSGEIVFSSDVITEGLRIDELDEAHRERKTFSASLRRGEPVIELEDGEGQDDRPRYYSEAYMPVIHDGALQGVIEVYVDLAEKAARYRQEFMSLVAVLVGLMAVGVALPGGAIWWKIQERRRAEDHIRHLAHHDALTGLPNRALFRDRLDQALASARRQGGMVAVICLDIDRFKEVNDCFGHPLGDKLLQAVATRLSETKRESDTVARLGGDEFAIVQTGLEQPEGADALVRRLLDVLSHAHDLDEHQLAAGVSLGVAVSPVDSSDPDQLLKCADIALYRAKAEGRGTFRFFEREMDARLQARRELEQDLRRALLMEEFQLQFQPQLTVATQDITGFEALVRWHSPKRGMVSPADFIPIAEETGLIMPLGEWILRQACGEAASWPPHLKVAVNLSPVQFRQRDLASLVARTLAETGLAPERLEVEITEGVLLNDTEATLETLAQLKALGVRIAMDDFGTGYSSLGYLQRFSFDKIKIDRSFVIGLEDRSGGDAIIRAVIALGRSLGISTTAEGVETEAQLAFLKDEKCGEVQGFHCGRPIPADQVGSWLQVRLPGQASAIRPDCSEPSGVDGYEREPAMVASTSR